MVVFWQVASVCCCWRSGPTSTLDSSWPHWHACLLQHLQESYRVQPALQALLPHLAVADCRHLLQHATPHHCRPGCSMCCCQSSHKGTATYARLASRLKWSCSLKNSQSMPSFCDHSSARLPSSAGSLSSYTLHGCLHSHNVQAPQSACRLSDRLPACQPAEWKHASLLEFITAACSSAPESSFPCWTTRPGL